jgi:outer membrane protein
MMRKTYSFKLLLTALLCLVSLAGSAQNQQTPQAFSLEECVNYALQHNVQVKNERLNLGIAKAQIGETTAQGLPQITGSGNITYNVEQQTSFLPGDFFGQPGSFVPVKFGTPYQALASGNIEQLIFNGSYFVGLRAAKVFKELSEKNLKKAEVDVAEGVSLAYYGALVAEERLRLLEANLGRLDSLLVETKAVFEAGYAEEIGVKRVQVNLNNLRTEYENVKASLALNKSALKFQMGIPMEQDIALADDIRDMDIEKELLLPADFRYADRVEYQQLQVQRDLAELDVKNNQVQYIPNLSAFYNLGWNAGRESFKDLFEPTVLESTDGEGNIVRQEVPTWNRYQAIGLNINIPIFDGLAKANRIRRTKLKVEQVQNQLNNLESAIDLELEEARINLENSLRSLEAQEENMELAQDVFQVARIKYQEGVGSSLEVIDAENAYKTAETNYFNSLYNALVARLAFQKASGSLLNNR